MTEVRQAPAARHVGAAEVLFCVLDYDADMALADARRWLDRDERDRAARFRFERDRDRFVRGRGFLRRELGRRLGRDPGDVPLAVGPMGKPQLSEGGTGGRGLHFNLSHSGGLAALALSPGPDVGLDIELADRTTDGLGCPDTLIDLCFGPDEAAAIRAAPDRDACFLRFWTAKEARMKLTGEGMALEPRSIVLVLADDGKATGYRLPRVPAAALCPFEADGVIGCVAMAQEAA